MKFNRKLIESKPEDQEVIEFEQNTKGHPFVLKWNKNFAKARMEAANGVQSGSFQGTGPYGDAGQGTGMPASAEPQAGALRGQTVGDFSQATVGLQVSPTMEIFSAVIRGFTRYMDDSFVRKYVTESTVFKVPLTEYQELVSVISAANAGSGAGSQFPHTEKSIDYAVVDLTTPESEKGGKVSWTRALLEDVTFDVQAEMMEGLGHAIAVQVMRDILNTLVYAYQDSETTSQTAYYESMPLGESSPVSITNGAITWAQFLSIVSAVDVGISVAATDGAKGVGIMQSRKTYGPADFALVSTDVYWQLLNIIQLTNVLYEGSTDPINTGRIKLALGVTLVKESLLPDNTVVALNSEKAIALVMRRNLKIEPVLFPVWNEYGFIGTVRYGVTILFPGAIQVGFGGGTAPNPEAS